MARQEVDIGIEGNDGTGDSIRESFKKVNQNFTELYAIFGLGGTVSFRSLDDTPDDYIGNEHTIPAVDELGTRLNLYKFVSDSGLNNRDVSNPSETTNSVFVSLEDPDPADPGSSGKLKIEIVDPHINRDPDPTLSNPTNAQAVMAYNNTLNTKLRNTGSGDDIDTLVGNWNTTHNGESAITPDNVIISKGYADDKYVNISGDVMTGSLSVPAGASGAEVPRTEEVITRAGSLENRTMLDDLFLADHPDPLQGFGTPNGPDDLQAVSKLYVDTQGYASTTNIFVSTSGDDKQRTTPPGQEGRSQTYAYRTINAAMRRVEQIIESTPFEPGPYVQTITYNNGASNSVIDTVLGVSSPEATSVAADTLVAANTASIQEQVVDHIDTTYPDLIYDRAICRRDIGLILKSISLDVQSDLAANYLTRWAGLRYYANPSAVKARTTQYAETVAGIQKAKQLVNDLLAADATVNSAVQSAYAARFDELLEYIDNDPLNDNPLIYGNRYQFDITNGGLTSVDQGISGNKDLIEGKVIVGKTSGAKGVITDYIRAVASGVDRIEVDLLEPIEFIAGEEMEFGAKTRNNQVTVRVESGIYFEHLPIKLPENVSIKGDEFRRTVIRPKPGVSQSKWANTYFYRDINVDGLIAAYSPAATVKNIGAANASRVAGTYTITSFATDGIGENAEFEVVVDGVGAATITINNGGDGFTIDENITISDGDLGNGGAPDLTFQIASTGGGYHFTHPVSGKQGKYGYHYANDPSAAINVSDFGKDNPGQFTDASELVRINKDFIIEEVIEFINVTYPSLVYNEAKCRRDTGLIVDGLVGDLKTGGRELTLTNQGAYYEGAVTGQETETAAAIQHISTLTTNILANDSDNPYAKLGTVDQVFDADLTAEALAETNLDELVDCVAYAFDASFKPPLNNSEMDVLLCNDGTILRNVTVQKHGGFMMVLDPEGQILTRSPYCQTGSSFSQSKGTRRNFAGGMLIDGYAGNMPATIDTVVTQYRLTISSPADEGLFVRRPPTPFPFYVGGKRYQVNAITNYNQSAGTCDLLLDETSNEGNGYTGSTGVDIFIQSGGNRSMLSNDFTQINDLGFGAIAINNALSELVSMFTYYCHTGYLAKDGSQIRSLGGNNSYGFYGLVADGSDPDEIPTDVTLTNNMVFASKVFRADKKIKFASIPGSIAIGETISQEVSGATGIVSFFEDGGNTVYIHTTSGNWNTSDQAYGDDSATLIGVPSSVTDIDLDADEGKLFVYAYDLGDNLPNNVSEVEILHDSGLYQPYEITNASKTNFYLGGYTGINDTISVTYAGSGTNGKFTLLKDRTNNYSLILTSAGVNYVAGETMVVAGTDLGGASPANDATITIDTVDSGGEILTFSVTGTPNFDSSSPVRSGRVWRLNLGTGLEGTAENGLQEETYHNTPLVIRHKQNFVFDGVEDLPTRPSTAVQFTDDTSAITYRTIDFGNQITDGETTGTNQSVITFDSNYRYIDLTAVQDYLATTENNVNLTVDPNYTDIIAAATPNGLKTLGSLVEDRFIAINPLDTANEARIIPGEMIMTWGGKVHLITGYARYDYDDGLGNTATLGVIQIADVAGSDVNWPATNAGLALSLVNSAGLTLKAGLAAGEDAQITVNISTCRATGHDMLDIGTGGFNTSNYPERIFGSPYGLQPVSTNDAIDENGTRSAAQVSERNKGRVFAVLTDQDGFFRVGRFFTVDQGTGSVTFNAALVLTNIDGIGFKRGVRVNEFSNDDTFTDAKGDAVPTQTAVEGYINARLGFDREGSTGVVKIGPGVMSLGGPGFQQTPMADDMNLGGFTIQNLGTPLNGSDAATKLYVDNKTDQLNDIGDVTITGSGGTITAHLLTFNGTVQNSENAAVVGDVTFSRTGPNQLTTSITGGVIVNADINASAAIDQSKLNMNAATTRANATGITQADLGLASFNSTEFTATDGWIELSTGGIANGKLANSDITIGGTSISLGGTSTSLSGMTGIAFTSGSISGTANWTATGSISGVTTISHTGNITGPANSGADNGVSIGSSANRYNTVWATSFNGTATEALYADLAENYLGDADYEPGTVVVFGGDAEVTVCTAKGQTSVAGVVTTNPAHLMNSALEGDHVVGLALQGRVPCKVIGTVKKGDMLVTSAVPGYAIVNNSPGVGQVIGKAVGTKTDEARGTVEVVVGRV